MRLPTVEPVVRVSTFRTGLSSSTGALRGFLRVPGMATRGAVRESALRLAVEDEVGTALDTTPDKDEVELGVTFSGSSDSLLPVMDRGVMRPEVEAAEEEEVMEDTEVVVDTVDALDGVNADVNVSTVSSSTFTLKPRELRLELGADATGVGALVAGAATDLVGTVTVTGAATVATDTVVGIVATGDEAITTEGVFSS